MQAFNRDSLSPWGLVELVERVIVVCWPPKNMEIVGKRLRVGSSICKLETVVGPTIEPGMLGLGELEQTSWRLWDLMDSDPLDSNIVKTFLLVLTHILII